MARPPARDKERLLCSRALSGTGTGTGIGVAVFKLEKTSGCVINMKNKSLAKDRAWQRSPGRSVP
jgi:hypothetical protein